MGRRPELIPVLALFFIINTAFARTRHHQRLAHKHYERIPMSWFMVNVARPIAKAWELLQAGKTIQAMEAVRRPAYREAPARFLYGRIALQARRYKEAKWALCARVKAMKPAGPWRDFWCGEALLALGKPGAALKRFERAAATPGGPGRRLQVYKSLALLRLGRKKTACQTIRKAYRTLPQNNMYTRLSTVCKVPLRKPAPPKQTAPTPLQQVKAAFSQANYQQAMDLLQAMDQTGCVVRNMIARTTQRLRQYAKARDLFLALANDPKCKGRLRGDWLLFRAAHCALGAGDIQGAKTITRRMIQEFPKTTLSDDMLVILARVALFHGDYKYALKTALQARKMFPKGDFRWYALWVAFLAHYVQGHYTQAIRLLKQADSCKDPYLAPRFMYWKYRAMEHLSKKKAIKGLRAVVNAFPLDFYGVLAANRVARLTRSSVRRVYMRVKNTQPPLPVFIQIPDRKTRLYGRPAMIRFLLASGMQDLARAELWGMSRGQTWEKWVAVLGFHTLKDLATSTGLAWHLLQKRPFFPSTWTGQKFYRLAYPRPFFWIVKHYAGQFGLNRWLVYGVMRRESVFKPDAKSWAGAVGLMQLMPATARSAALHLRYSRRTARRWSNESHLKMPRINVKLGTWYLNYLMHLFKNPLFAAAGYNAGEDSVYRLMRKYPHRSADELVELIEARETRRYVRAVIEGYARYRFLYEKGATRYLRLDF